MHVVKAPKTTAVGITTAQLADDLAVKFEAAIPTATQASLDRFVITDAFVSCHCHYVFAVMPAVDHWVPTGGPLMFQFVCKYACCRP